jgi:hypothetical protein
MAINVPMPALPLTGLNQAIATGGNLFSQMINPVIKREDMQRQWKQHLDTLALQKAAAGRASAMAPLQLRLAQLQLEAAERDADPAKKMAYIQQIMQGIQGMGGQGGNGGQIPPEQPMQPFMGGGMPSIQEMEQPTPQAPTQQTLQQGFQGFTPEQQMAASLGGIKLPTFKENPAQKRALDLQGKIELEQQKSALKKKELEDKEVVAAQKDIPTIRSSLEGVDELIKIATNNPDMFGHTFMPDRYAKTSKNKNFGTWQNLIADRIAGLEGKLSSKGNIVALKMAQSLKPSHAEQQQVALGKLYSMRKELEKQLQRSESLTGKAKGTAQFQDNDMVIVETPNGEQTMTYAEAKKLGAE